MGAANPIYGTFDPTLDLAKNIGLPDSLLSRFDLVFVVRDITTEEVDRKIATQVLRQAQLRPNGDSRRGVEQIHSSILERRQEADGRKAQEAAEVFEKTVLGPDGGAAPEVLTVDFLRKYLRYCKRLEPVLSDKAQKMVAEKYVDMRTRFQSGFAELNDPSSTKKPRLAVTTRTLEALIRLATAHAKLKLRKEEVLEEDVIEAYNLMLAAREEEIAVMPGSGAAGDDDDAPPPAPGGDDDTGRGQKRSSAEAGLGEGGISPGRLGALTTLVARTFARQGMQSLPITELLEIVNAGLVEGELPFGESEFEAGMEQLEQQNKIMKDDAGNVLHIG